eukprot:scaffold20967_cov24-Tisochrysis_lutea.AAC.3
MPLIHLQVISGQDHDLHGRRVTQHEQSVLRGCLESSRLQKQLKLSCMFLSCAWDGINAQAACKGPAKVLHVFGAIPILAFIRHLLIKQMSFSLCARATHTHIHTHTNTHWSSAWVRLHYLANCNVKFHVPFLTPQGLYHLERVDAVDKCYVRLTQSQQPLSHREALSLLTWQAVKSYGMAA